MICPHCGKDTDRRLPTLADIIGPEKVRELIEAERLSREKAAAMRARRRRRPPWERQPRRIGD